MSPTGTITLETVFEQTRAAADTLGILDERVEHLHLGARLARIAGESTRSNLEALIVAIDERASAGITLTETVAALLDTIRATPDTINGPEHRWVVEVIARMPRGRRATLEASSSWQRWSGSEHHSA